MTHSGFRFSGSANDIAYFFAKLIPVGLGKNGKVIFFIDGLDQLALARAVELLDAMRDFFECKGCVFVVSAEYADILQGAQERYGENRAKHFFDEMFKMPFRVPASSFSIKSYVKSKLEDMGIQAGGDAELELSSVTSR